MSNKKYIIIRNSIQVLGEVNCALWWSEGAVLQIGYTHQFMKSSLAELFVVFVSDLFGCISFILLILRMPIERNSANDVHYYTGSGSVSHRPKHTTRFWTSFKDSRNRLICSTDKSHLFMNRTSIALFVCFCV